MTQPLCLMPRATTAALILCRCCARNGTRFFVTGAASPASALQQTEEDEVFAKIDYANAFNSVSRSAIADAVLEHVPELARYVLAAYGDASLLFCGGAGTINSEVGAQQGDPRSW